MKTKNICIALLLLFLCAGTVYAQEDTDSLFKNNAFSASVGRHFHAEGEFTDFWDINPKGDMDSAIGSLSLEKKILKYIGLEFSLGFFDSGKHDKMFRATQTFTMNTASMDIHNYFLSTSAKCYLPFGDSLFMYAGGGMDYYHTVAGFEYDQPIFAVETADDGTTIREGYFLSFTNSSTRKFHTLGYHALGGIEFYIYKNPKKHGFFDVPMSVFLDYTYSWGKVKNLDEHLLSYINAAFDTTIPYHDLNLEGPNVLAGLRWHY